MEKDCKLFKKKLGGWQEAYMDRLIEEYKDILNSDASSFDKYWALRKKIYDDYKFEPKPIDTLKINNINNENIRKSK